MSILTPPANFWPQPVHVDFQGVTSAIPPLYINVNTISVSDASATASGVLTTGAQVIGGVKNFTSGLNIGTTQAVQEISTDNTFAGATDTRLATQKAIKDYITSHTLATGLNEPLYLNLTNIDIRDASLTTRGVMTTGTQSIAGAKTFTGNVHVNGDEEIGGVVTLTRPLGSGGCSVQAVGTNQSLYIGCTSTGSSIVSQSLTQGGALVLSSAAGLSAGLPTEILMVDGLSMGTLFKATSARNTSYCQTYIVSDTTPQFAIQSLLGTATFTLVSGGDLTIDTSGNDLNFHSTDKVHVLNNTAATSKTDGALQINGGVGCSGLIFADGHRAIGTTSPHFFAQWTPGTATYMTCTSQGRMTLDSTGTSPRIDLSYNGITAHNITSTLVTFGGTVVGTNLTATAGAVYLGGSTPTVAPLLNNTSLMLCGGSSPGAGNGATIEAYSTSAGGNIILTTGNNGGLLVKPYPTPGGTVFEVTDSFVKSYYTTELAGMLKYKATEESYSPVGTGPFNDYALTSTAITYKFDLSSTTSGAHFTGFVSSTPQIYGRRIVLYFLSASPKTIYIDHLSLSSTGIYRVACPNATNLELNVNVSASVTMEHPGSTGPWIVLGSTGTVTTPTFASQTYVHTLSGAGAGATCTVVYEKVGKTVIAHFGGVQIASAGAGAITFAVGSEIPTDYCPTNDESNTMLVINGAANTSDAHGRYAVHPAGTAQFFTDANMGGFVGVGTVGWFALTLHWYRT